jgi:alkylhydroperoxidase family enzyme
VRFAVARQQGLTEDVAALVDDGYEASALAERYKAVVAYADAFLSGCGTPSQEVRAALQAELTDAQVVELTMALALFHGFSKMLIVLGLEPETMATTVLPTPDVV